MRLRKHAGDVCVGSKPQAPCRGKGWLSLAGVPLELSIELKGQGQGQDRARLGVFLALPFSASLSVCYEVFRVVL